MSVCRIIRNAMDRFIMMPKCREEMSPSCSRVLCHGLGNADLVAKRYSIINPAMDH